MRLVEKIERNNSRAPRAPFFWALNIARQQGTQHRRGVEYKSKELPKEKTGELNNIYWATRDEIVRVSDVGEFVLSTEAIKILERYEAESGETKRAETFFDYLETEWSIAHKYYESLHCRSASRSRQMKHNYSLERDVCSVMPSGLRYTKALQLESYKSECARG